MIQPSTYLPPPTVDKDQLIRSHLSLVHFLVDRMVTQVPASVTREDLTSAAMMGLVDAANRFDPGKGVLFKTFAEPRIRGAIMDDVRRMDWFSRSMREKQQRLFAAIHQLESRLGRTPEEDEIAEVMGLSLPDYRQLLTDVGHLGCISLEESLDGSDDGRTMIENLGDPNGKDPEALCADSELTRDLAEHLATLSEKERLVIALYYYEELTQREISQVLEVTEGRISQLHSQALAKLKVKLKRSDRRSALRR